jgi:hypothetical protein
MVGGFLRAALISLAGCGLLACGSGSGGFSDLGNATAASSSQCEPEEPAVGSCVYSYQGTQVCSTFHGRPQGATEADYQQACAEFGENQQGGVWSSSGCPPSDLGACRFGFSVGVDVVSYFYAGGGLTSELARQACEDINQIDEDGDLDLMSTWCEG